MNTILSGRCVLVVEDEMMILLMIEDMLSELGCNSVTAASSVAEAIDLINTKVFDAAMLDMNLSGERSDAVADALAAHDIPFAFSTGYGAHVIRECHQERPVLKKPFKQEDLSSVFNELLSRPGLH